MTIKGLSTYWAPTAVWQKLQDELIMGDQSNVHMSGKGTPRVKVRDSQFNPLLLLPCVDFLVVNWPHKNSVILPGQKSVHLQQQPKAMSMEKVIAPIIVPLYSKVRRASHCQLEVPVATSCDNLRQTSLPGTNWTLLLCRHFTFQSFLVKSVTRPFKLLCTLKLKVHVSRWREGGWYLLWSDTHKRRSLWRNGPGIDWCCADAYKAALQGEPNLINDFYEETRLPEVAGIKLLSKQLIA